MWLVFQNQSIFVASSGLLGIFISYLTATVSGDYVLGVCSNNTMNMSPFKKEKKATKITESQC